MEKLFAAIDVGTVTCRLLVASCSRGSIVPVARRSEFVNLGIGVEETGCIAQPALERLRGVLADYCSVVRSLGEAGSIPVRAVATSACRDAANASQVERIFADCGLGLRIIEGTQEAAYSFAGASMGYDGQHLLVSDIGGGSTELIAGIGGGQVSLAHSFNIGCRRLTERFLHSDPPLPEELIAARAWVRPQLAEFFERAAQAGCRIDRLVSVAGTATSVISMRDGMAVYDPERVQGSVATRAQLSALVQRLSAMTNQQREHVVGLQPKRAGVIVAGLLILEEVMDAAGVECFTASENDILQGIVMHMAREDQ